MLDRWGVELMCSALRPDMDVLEYGSGGSTTFFRWMIIYLFLDLVDKIVIVFFLPFHFFLSRKLINSSQFVRSWTSMEHDSNWEPKVGTRQCLVDMSFLCDLVLIYDSDSMLRLRLDLSFKGAQHTEEVALGGPSDVVHGASRYALQVI